MPTIAFAGTGLVAGVVVEALGRLDDRAVMVLRIVAQPLWFIGIYLGVVAFAPWMLPAHRRFGVRVLVVLTALVAVVDVLRIGLDLPYVGSLNFAFVWLVVHQCGFLYADGGPQRGGRRFALTLAGVGLVLTVALVALGPYPRSMVALPGETTSNMTPSFALLTFSAWLLGLALLLRPALTRLMAGRGPWTVVVAASGVAMTAFLWHLTAITMVSGGLLLSGGPFFPDVGSVSWWLLRLVFLLLVVAVLTVLVALFRRFERPRRLVVPPPGQRRAHRDGLAALGLALSLLGVLGFSVAGFAGVLSRRTATLVVLPMTPAVAALLLGLGALLVRWAAAPVSRRRSSGPSSGPAA